ncbi:DDE-type integrase/transposase/recombinase [Pleurocapsa sp. FMAR1]|uniref:DDE-type integrase/transposase/recombinase n=1 Tax=Pleurocapsa sp. FMAR1 TaxID=3040204 RepID=UPI0039AEDA41
MPTRTVKYLNNSIEQDHRLIELRVTTSQNFRNFWSAYKTTSGYELMNMIPKGQSKNVKREAGLRCDLLLFKQLRNAHQESN